MKALVYERAPARYAAARLTAAIRGSGAGASHGPLRLAELRPPELPGAEWVHILPTLSGICGSDLATVDGTSSRYFEELVSFPFVPGHEVVGTVTEPPGDAGVTHGDRVVIEPVIGCVPRGITPPCAACATGHTGNCQHVAFGHLAPGLQIGYCADTGGGWSTAGLVAHTSQIHSVPATFTDEDAVMVEPTACAVHGALAAGIEPQHQVAVVGAGTLGLATIAAIHQLCPPSHLLVGAKYAHQQDWAAQLGADHVVSADQLERAVRRSTRSLRSAHHDTGGVDVVVDCVGTAQSLASALAMVRPRGRVVLLGMPGRVSVDLAGLWHREITLVGTYAYGTETLPGAETLPRAATLPGAAALSGAATLPGAATLTDTATLDGAETLPRAATLPGAGRTDDHVKRRTFDLAFEVVAAGHLGRLVSARYPLDRYSEALAHAGSAGRRGAVKIVFDLAARSPRPAPRVQLTPTPSRALRSGRMPSSTRKGPLR